MKPRASTPITESIFSPSNSDASASTVLRKPFRMFQQRGDVIKIDAGLGKVRHFAD